MDMGLQVLSQKRENYIIGLLDLQLSGNLVRLLVAFLVQVKDPHILLLVFHADLDDVRLEIDQLEIELRQISHADDFTQLGQIIPGCHLHCDSRNYH